LSTKKHTPKIIPTIVPFSILNERQKVWELLKSENISMPIGEICNSLNEVKNFLISCKRQGFRGCIIKQGHRNKLQVVDEVGLNKISLQTNYPVLVEAIYDCKLSPVAQVVRWKRRTSTLFVLDQNIKEFHHYGNEFPSKISTAHMRSISQLANEIASIFQDYEGVLGVDFILTEDNKLLVVDVNPRFNSSTYPFYFAQKHADFTELPSVVYRTLENKDYPDLSSVLRRIGSL